MKDVENLFKRLGTKSDYQDFGSKVLDDVRQKWPLLDDVSLAEKLRTPPVKNSMPVESRVEEDQSQAELPVPKVVKPVAPVSESRLPVRAFVSRKAPAQESVRDIFKSIGKSQRLSPAKESESTPKSKSLFDGTLLNNGKKT